MTTISINDRMPVDAADLIRFVRETLGCGCPDEVLARIAVDVSEHDERGLDVGGRLLVRVLPADDLDRLIETFPTMVGRLLAERDRRGFHRLRMVVAHSEHEVLGDVLDAMLGVIVAADERVFLHAVDVEGLPIILDPVV